MYQRIILVGMAMAVSFAIAGVVQLENYCDGGTLLELRMTDCSGTFPCTVKRQKNYTIEGDFSVVREVKNPNLKCTTKYLGRDISLPGHGSCDTLVNASCPLQPGIVYTTTTTFNIPAFVPPKLYEVKCRMVDDNNEDLLCGEGSGNVI